MGATLSEMVEWLDGYLAIDAVADASLNGLQVEAGESVGCVALAVDAAAETIREAIDADCNLLLVHHGLLFGPPQRLRGSLGANAASCFRGGLSLYAAHLPLDLHPQVGNNVLLARALGAEPSGTFGDHGGVDIGLLAALPQPMPLAELAGSFAAAGCDEQRMWAFGPDPVSRLAIVTGSGCSLMAEAIAAGVDCFISGEPRHSAYHQAREAGLNCLFGGHYATETFGVKAVGELLAERFEVDTRWIEHPTGV